MDIREVRRLVSSYRDHNTIDREARTHIQNQTISTVLDIRKSVPTYMLTEYDNTKLSGINEFVSSNRVFVDPKKLQYLNFQLNTLIHEHKTSLNEATLKQIETLIKLDHSQQKMNQHMQLQLQKGPIQDVESSLNKSDVTKTNDFDIDLGR